MSPTPSFPVRLALVALLAAACLAACHHDPAPAAGPTEPAISRPFPQAGQVNMHLSAGKYVIEGSPDDRIRVTAQTRDPDDARKVRLDLQAAGLEATLRTDGPSNGFEVAVAVPARADLWIRLSAGDLAIRGIEGHKDLSAWAGEMKIAVGDGASYRRVEASVLAGEIQAPALNRTTGGVFRSFSWSGTGNYDLRARLTAGEIHLRER
jgi:hypothetical protein